MEQNSGESYVDQLRSRLTDLSRNDWFKALSVEEAALEKDIARREQEIVDLRDKARRKIDRCYSDEPEEARRFLLEWIIRGMPDKSHDEKWGWDTPVPRLLGNDTKHNLWRIWWRKVRIQKSSINYLKGKLDTLRRVRGAVLSGRLKDKHKPQKQEKPGAMPKDSNSLVAPKSGNQPGKADNIKQTAARVFEGKSRTEGANTHLHPAVMRWAVDAFHELTRNGKPYELAKDEVICIAERHGYHFSRRTLERHIKS